MAADAAVSLGVVIGESSPSLVGSGSMIFEPIIAAVIA
jgi:hypothetical protein